MMRIRRVLLSVLSVSSLCALAPNNVVAETKLAVETMSLSTLFDAGSYSEVADRAASLKSADGYALAARSVLAEYMTSETRALANPEDLDRAEMLARKSLALNPNLVEGKIQLAVSLSLRASLMSVGEVRSSGVGELGRALMEEVIAGAPDTQYAHAFLSVWHVEVRRRGGAIGASVMGASLKKGRQAYASAVALGAGDVGAHWQYARALAALNARKHRKEITHVLEAALAADARTHLDGVMQARAKRLSALMQDDTRKAKKLALELL